MSASETFVPAEVFHASQLIADECIARGWSIWDLVDRIGTLDAPLDVTAWELYAGAGPLDPLICMGDESAVGLQLALGIDKEIWLRTEALCKAYPDRIQPLDEEAMRWYDLTDDSPAATPPETTDCPCGHEMRRAERRHIRAAATPPENGNE